MCILELLIGSHYQENLNYSTVVVMRPLGFKACKCVQHLSWGIAYSARLIYNLMQETMIFQCS